MIKKTFYSNGKLLITAEYVVLDGAKALALPTKFGQYLTVEKTKSNLIHWKSHDFDKTVWFSIEINLQEIISNFSKNEDGVSQKLIEILHHANTLNPDILKNFEGFQITTSLTFPRKWGLGTSSTLLHNVAQWFEIDAFELLNRSFGGSGYDIACAKYNLPILYSLKNNKPTIDLINFRPLFSSKLFFVYLNKKQNSNQAIANYRTLKFNKNSVVDTISNITNQLIQEDLQFDRFCELLILHEKIIAGFLNLLPIHQEYFADFTGVVKSLGAWGGDFVLVASHENPTDYFLSKGYETVLGFDEMILL
jgi:mevalonate kinase